MAKDQHTPTPWLVTDEIDRIYNGELIRPVSGNPSPVAVVCDFNRFDRDEERKANAAFIVKAVNAHDALVDAARSAIALIESYENKEGADLIAAEEMPDEWEELRAALALVDGEPVSPNRGRESEAPNV